MSRSLKIRLVALILFAGVCALVTLAGPLSAQSIPGGGSGSTFTGALGSNVLRQTQSASGNSKTVDTTAMDALSAKWNLTYYNGVGANTPCSSRPDIVQMMGYNITSGGGRELSTEPSLHWAIENLFCPSGGVPSMEMHFQFQGTDGVIHRLQSGIYPVDGSATAASTSFSAPLFSWQNWSNTPMMDMNWSTKQINLYNGMQIVHGTNGVYDVQLNAAGSAYLKMPWYDAQNRLSFEGPTILAASPYSGSGAVHQETILTMSNGQTVYAITLPTLSGSYYTITPFYATGSIQGELDMTVQNTGTGAAQFVAKTSSANSGSDPQFCANIVSGTTWCMGADNSINDHFAIGNSTALGVSDQFTIDTTIGFSTLTLPLKVPATVATGSAPTVTGTCTSVGTQVGGNTAGTMVATCTAGQTLILTFATTAPNGWDCVMQDRTTAVAPRQTASTTTTCTVTVLAGAGVADVYGFQAQAY